ncbi:hypothetical protein L1987_24692 [Smallanthus sonchifolius]|uniref:Uncharacterized protein n=1 Tax=Smallanthus sonchifolius TaxID=185202 RepID=A0ACB9IKH7_9ASTR|nr:hypothetical protein L1987_24692 [Smallanthus sonchifolius]
MVAIIKTKNIRQFLIYAGGGRVAEEGKGYREGSYVITSIFQLDDNDDLSNHDEDHDEIACSGGGEGDKQEEADITEAFKVFDEDGNGYISTTELQAVLVKQGFAKGNEIGRVEMTISSVDRNHDGRVDYMEIKDMMCNVVVLSAPKTGTTWLKSLAFAITTREKFDESTNPLLTKLAHECVPYLERPLEEFEDAIKNSSISLLASHLPYASLPESVAASNCKIVYIYRNVKDVIVSWYHFLREIVKVPMEDAPFEEAFEEFCQGISGAGPYWDHILGYWKASLERPDRDFVVLENRVFFRKAKDGDWQNYFSDEMKEKIDKLMDEKLSGTGLVLK